MNTGSNIIYESNKRFSFPRRGKIIKKSPKPGYVFVRFDGDTKTTRVELEYLRLADQTMMDVLGD